MEVRICDYFFFSIYCLLEYGFTRYFPTLSNYLAIHNPSTRNPSVLCWFVGESSWITRSFLEPEGYIFSSSFCRLPTSSISGCYARWWYALVWDLIYALTHSAIPPNPPFPIPTPPPPQIHSPFPIPQYPPLISNQTLIRSPTPPSPHKKTPFPEPHHTQPKRYFFQHGDGV